jgi:hypothetical protein
MSNNQKEQKKLKYSDPETLKVYIKQAEHGPYDLYEIWYIDFKDKKHTSKIKLPSYLESYKKYKLLELYFGTQQEIIERHRMKMIKSYGYKEIIENEI